MTEKDIQVGDKVQWNYGGSHPQGVAAEIKTQPGEKVQIESKKGNIISRNADPNNAAVLIERQGDGNNQDVVKKQSELTKVGQAEGTADADADADSIGEDDAEILGKEGNEPVVGQKRDRDAAEQGKAEGEGEEGQNAVTETSVMKDEKQEAKKAKLDKEEAAKDKGKQGSTKGEPKAKPGRGQGRARAKTRATTAAGPRRTGRTKRGATSTIASEEQASGGAEGDQAQGDAEGTEEFVMAEAVSPGEIEEGAKIAPEEAPAGHTRSKNQEVNASSYN